MDTQTETNGTKKLSERVIARLEKGWCTGNYAQDQYGNIVGTTAPMAVAWCLAGALLADPEEIPLTFSQTLDEIARERGFGGYVNFNDSQTDAAPVIALVREAGARCGL